MLRTIRERYLPNRVIMHLDPAVRAAAPGSPQLQGRDLVVGRPAVYICRNYTCKLPITDVEIL